MLRMIRNMYELNFRSLCEVYRDNEEILGSCEGSAEKCLEAEQKFYHYLHDVFFRTPKACYALWEQDGRYLAALRLEPYRDGLVIAALETTPDARGNGHATALMSAVLSQFRDQNIYSHIRKDNFTSLRVHEKCGFFRVSDSAVLLDGSVTSSHWTFCLKSE